MEWIVTRTRQRLSQPKATLQILLILFIVVLALELVEVVRGATFPPLAWCGICGILIKYILQNDFR